MEEYQPQPFTTTNDTTATNLNDVVTPKSVKINPFTQLVSKIKTFFSAFFKKWNKHGVPNRSFNPDQPSIYSPTSSSSKFNFSFKKGPALLIVAAVILIGLFLAFSLKGNNSSIIASTLDGKTAIKGAKATTDLKREFQFPIRDDKGKEITKLKFEIVSAELRDEVVAEGRKRTAIQGRTILVLNIKLTNDYSKGIQINTSDYIRLFVDDSIEPHAADFKSDPVTVQPISTKETRLGYSIDDTKHSFKLKIGEIDGEKTDVDFQL